MKKEAAFTLIEVLISIMIVGVILSISLPSFTYVNKNLELKNVANEIAGDLRYVQQRAVNGDLNIYMLIRNNRYAIISRSKYEKNVSLPKGIEIENNFQISFSEYGRPVNGGTIWIKNENGKYMSLVVTPVTGLIRIVEGKYIPD